ncbi:MAG: ATP-binding protein [Lishizhenia sp.]
MQNVKDFFYKYLITFLGIISIAVSLFLYTLFVAPNYTTEIASFQKDILRLEKEIKVFSDQKLNEIKNTVLSQLWRKLDKKTKFDYFITEDDSLVFWTSNQLNPKAVNENKSITKTNNGIYLTETVQFESLKLISALQLKSQFPYQNESLKNEFLEEIRLPQELTIKSNELKGTPIYNGQKEYLFSVHPTGQKNTTPEQELSIFLFFILGVYALLRASFGLFEKIKLDYIRYLSFTFFLGSIVCLALLKTPFSLFDSFELYDSLIYASSETLFPHLAQWCFNILFIALFVQWSLKFIHLLNLFYTSLFFLFLLAFGLSISVIFKSSIVDSTIPMEIDKLFSLNKYSFITLLGISILFYLYFVLGKKIIVQFEAKGLRANHAVLIWFFSALALFFLSVFYFEHPYFIGLWLSILNGILFYVGYSFKGNYTFGIGIIIITVFAFYGALMLSEYNLRNEYQAREIYAYDLASEYDPNVELEYIEIQKKTHASQSIKSSVLNPIRVSVSEFKVDLEKKIYTDFWERYDIEFFVFNANREPIINYTKTADYNKLEQQINLHGKPSKIVDGIYFIEDYIDKISYISKEEIKKGDSTIAYLFATYKSKKIPEQIGFPRLLINKKAKVFEELENYSMAKYRLGKLTTRYNHYNYPLDENVFLNQFNKTAGFVEENGFSHYIYKTDALNTLVLSKPSLTRLSVLTSFSYLFTFFGVLLLFPAILANQKQKKQFRRFNFSFKIQLVLISLVFVALLVFGLVSGGFVKSQYTDYTNDNIQERIYSVNTEVQQKLGDKENLDKDSLGNYMEYILQKFSRVFVTDINLFDLKGNLLASSQPKIYKIGLTTAQIDPFAYKELRFNKRSEFIHNESIGELNYLSAYIPFMNKNGKLLAYLNLQYFAKQNEYENQISSFLVALINLAVLLIVSTIVVAIFVTNWITTPLKLIQRSFSSVELGKKTQPINYSGDDEIGALVREYNAKLAELEVKALQLAKSEREMAWREMAKQVAHEIKNPLTPMKLRLQHFERSFDPQDKEAKEKLRKNTASLIEQINALTNIANEFSNFAKMPKPKEEQINLIPLIESCIVLFKDIKNIELSLHTDLIEAIVIADKNLMLRVFNNLIKNSIQAIPEDKTGGISINIYLEQAYFYIDVTDNGVGIPKNEQSKIFVPNFTTKSTGTGLGLAMVKQIIENHNGTIWFETEINSGTIFRIKIPKKEN